MPLTDSDLRAHERRRLRGLGSRKPLSCRISREIVQRAGAAQVPLEVGPSDDVLLRPTVTVVGLGYLEHGDTIAGGERQPARQQRRTAAEAAQRAQQQQDRASSAREWLPGHVAQHREYIQLQQRLADAAREQACEQAERERQEQRRRRRADCEQDASGGVRRRQHREGCGWTWQGGACSSFCTDLTVALPVAARLPVSCTGNGLRGDCVNADGRHVLPALDVECPHCGASHFPQEKVGCQAAVIAFAVLLFVYGN